VNGSLSIFESGCYRRLGDQQILEFFKVLADQGKLKVNAVMVNVCSMELEFQKI
jgi:hypothetical protein